MDKAVLFQQIVQHIGEYLETDVSHLTMDSRPGTALPGLDSLKLFEMILYLEDCFGVEFDESVMENMATLGDLTDYVQRQMPAEATA
jgi:acyl carrier protein